MHGPDRAGEHLLLRDLRMSDATVILNALLLLSVVQPALRLVGLDRTATWASRLIGQPISAARPTLNDTELDEGKTTLSRIVGLLIGLIESKLPGRFEMREEAPEYRVGGEE